MKGDLESNPVGRHAVNLKRRMSANVNKLESNRGLIR